MLQDTLQDLIVRFGYYALYGLLAFGIIGLPVPDEVLMTFVGYLTSIGYMQYCPALAVSFAGAMTGMSVSYFIGRKVGKPFLWRYGKLIKLTPARLNKADLWFHKYGLWTVSFGYFVPGVRHFTCYLAGVSGVKFWKYLLFAGSGALVWCAVFITLGRFIGKSMDTVLQAIHHYVGQGLFLLLAAAAVIGILVYQRRSNRSNL